MNDSAQSTHWTLPLLSRNNSQVHDSGRPTRWLTIFLAASTRVWGAIANIVFLPLYARHLGPNAFGIVASYSAAVGVLAMAAAGMPQATMRSLSSSEGVERAAGIVSAFEKIVHASCGLLLLIGLPFLASHRYVNTTVIASSTTLTLVTVLCFAAAAVTQVSVSLYDAALYGLGHGSLANTAALGSGVARGLAGWAAVLAPSDKLLWFFFSQFMCWALHYLAVRHLTALRLRLLIGTRPTAPVPLREALLTSAPFALASFLSIAQLQLPQLLVVALSGTSAAGRYALIATLGGAIVSLVASPIQQVLFRPVTEAFAKAMAHSSTAYLDIARALSILVVPVSATLISLPATALRLWLRVEPTPDQVTGLRVFALGASFQAILCIPYSAMIGKLRPSMGAQVGAITLAAGLPLCILLVSRFGVTGAAAYWLALHVAQTVLLGNKVHGAAAPTLQSKWLTAALIIPFTAAAAAIIVSTALPKMTPAPRLVAQWALIQAIVAIAHPAALTRITSEFRRFSPRG